MDFERLREVRNKTNGFANLIGLTITKIESGYAEGEIDVSRHLTNPIGSVHGGCLYTMCDTVGGAAASSHGYQVTTMSGDIHYLRPGLHKKKLYAKAEELKAGKRVLVYLVTIYDEEGEDLAAATMTYMCLTTPVELDLDKISLDLK